MITMDSERVFPSTGSEDTDPGGFDPFAPPPPPTPSATPPPGEGPPTPDQEALLQELHTLRERMAHMEGALTQPPPTPPTPPALPKYERPSDDKIREVYERDPIAGASLLTERMLQERVGPLVAHLTRIHNEEIRNIKANNHTTVEHMAQRAAFERIRAIPGATDFTEQIVHELGNYTAEEALRPGVLDNAIYSILGRAAAEGKFVPPVPASSFSGGTGGSRTPAESPESRRMFKILTGREAPEGAIEKLSSPFPIDFASGRRG